jgi:N-acetylmuramic acid 6-phosphate etherase
MRLPRAVGVLTDDCMPTQSKWQSLPTEAINPVSLAVDKTPIRDIVEMVINEDRKVLAAVHKEKERIAHGVEIVAQALHKGGRVIFVGAGTSGRLGVVEAAEMPPTFGTSPNIVQAIMAGGQEAVFRAKEGVEDNYEEGARSLARLRIGRKDVVVGVSASGMTPFVRGALTRARKAGAKIIFVTCWPGSELQTFVDVQIAPAVGPELIAGSTRLKAGTATKIALNAMSTAAFVLLGKTYGGLMVDVRPTNAKLWARAIRIVRTLSSGLDDAAARRLIEKAGGRAKVALVMHHAGVTAARAKELLVKHKGSLRAIVGDLDGDAGKPAGGGSGAATEEARPGAAAR